MMVAQKERPWHSLSAKDVLEEFSSSHRGLLREEAGLRLTKYGKNSFEKREQLIFLKSLFRQIKSPLVFILLIAGAVTLSLGAYSDSAVILIAVVINTFIGVFQEGKASQAFDKLKRLQKKYATVVRDGEKQVIPSTKVVPGDILIISSGDQIVADARLLECKGLEVNEAVLTGEWLAGAKQSQKEKEETSLLEQKSMVWMGTLVTEGWGKAVIVATGFYTQVGKIAQSVEEEKAPPTPFQKSVKKVARLIGFVVLGALILIFGLGLLRGQPVSQMFFTSVAIAVAAIPEGLPVAVSVVLAIGMERILSRGGLVKQLDAAEALGSIDVILTDKTGTLTQAVMRVSDIVTAESLEEEKKKTLPSKGFGGRGDDRSAVLEMAILASDAFVENPKDALADWIVRGRPLEQALVIAGMEFGLYQHKLLEKEERIDFLTFDSERRFAASLNKFKKNKTRVFVNGAAEYILDLSKQMYKGGRVVNMSEKKRVMLKQALEKQTSAGARLIAVAYREGEWRELPRITDHVFENFVFAGFIVFHDPLRSDVVASFRKAEKAGIKAVMLTGDHEKTAQKIAKEIGFINDNDTIIGGSILEKWSDKELADKVENIRVFARVLPHQKLRIVKAWQEKGKTVAMTGDGVNDAPSLRRAEVGVALNSGTEVTKEASEIVLLNNSFTTIIAAIEEGRRILLNLRKILVYLLSTGFSEIILVGFSLVVGLPLPILPAQILWTNLVEEGFMNFAFAFEPKEKGIMRTPPSSFASKSLLTKEAKFLMSILAGTTSILLIFLFLVFNFVLRYPIEYTRTLIFGALAVDSVFFAFSLKSFKKQIWKINIFSNYYLLGSVLISFVFLFGALFIPQMRFLLSLEKIGLSGFLVIIGAGIANLVVAELAKHFLIIKKKR